LDDHSKGLLKPETGPRRPPSESAADRALRRREVSIKIRDRGAWQRLQAQVCITLVILLLFGGGAFFYYAHTLALNELKAQSELVSNRRAAIDAESAKVKQDEDQLKILRQRVADRAAGSPKIQRQVLGAFPSSIALYGVYFTDPNHGWVVGSDGTLLLTTDGGASWLKRDSGVSAHLYGVHFTDPNHGWAVGANGTILLTTDGASWQKRDSGVSVNLRGVHFTDPNHGWAVGGDGTILFTADGGVTWQKRDSGVSASLFGVHFTDPNHGWAVGSNGTVILTTDGASCAGFRPPE
jgi:photosystem II stability/assembly factor-like uncharacterized protein